MKKLEANEAPKTMIETGTTLQQRYKIDKQIGQGGMGAVYVATDSRFGSTVAIKETLCMDDNFRKAIEREARLLNSLKHSALPKVTDHFEENGIMFLVMEYIPGEDLCCTLDERGKPFPVEEMVRWGDQLLDALDFLHNQEIPVIHRDIKPQNLKLTPQGQVILLDFGLAKGNPSDVSHQTAAKSIFGYSRNYASLEQIQGTGTDPRSDLYSLAATLYHLLTGVAPEDALTRAMSVLSQKPDPLAPASSVNPEVPRGVAGVLQKAMDLNASERPASAAEMRQMLRESDKYAYLAESATFATNVSDPKVFAQPTRLMPEATRPMYANSNAKTEVLPTPVSEMTSVRSAVSGVGDTEVVGATTFSPAPRRGFGMAAGAAMMLLLGVAAVAGVYFVRPSVLGIANEPQKSAEPPAATRTAENPATVSSSAVANTGSSAEGESTGESNTARMLTENNRGPEGEKPVDPAKPATKPTASSKQTTEKDQGEVTEITVDDPEIPRGGVTLTERDENGQVRTIRVNPVAPPGGFRPPPDGRPMPPFPGVDMSKLTPVQRQKLMRMLRNNPQYRPQMQPRPTPPPQPKN